MPASGYEQMSSSAPNGPVPRVPGFHPAAGRRRLGPASHLAGAGASVTWLVRFWPWGVCQPRVTLTPGRKPSIVWVSDPGVVTAWPFTVVITSPLIRPALAAGVVHSTPSTSAPWRVGAVEARCAHGGWGV